jgi:hypothetical protein
VASSTVPATTLPPTSTTTSVPFAPAVTSTSRPTADPRRPFMTAESRPATTTTVPAAEPNHRYTSAPDLAGAWELDFTMPGAEKLNRYTITLKPLADSTCGGSPPCYGGQWFSAGQPVNNNASMWPLPGPTGFAAADNDLFYRGTVVDDDTRRPLSYQGTWWTKAGGTHGTFVFTRVG